MKEEILTYLAKPGKKVQLKNYDTSYKGTLDKEIGKKELEAVKLLLNASQQKLYAANTHSVLVIFQAMDAAGKDSTIEHVFSGINPQGCQVFNFKTPTSEEYEHDFLWRHYRALPERGRIGVHNRSHYENVLVCKVHPKYILNENLPGYTDVNAVDQKFWKNRYETIQSFEKHLSDNGTVLIKIFLHVSKEEQKKRFLDRLNDKDKNWKFAEGDLQERKLWDKYRSAYEDAITATSTDRCPWFIIPADKKWYARLVIAKIIAETLENLDLKFPVLGNKEKEKLEEYKQQLLNE